MISRYFEWGKIFTALILCLSLSLASYELHAQTIPGTGSETNTCGDCTPTGWSDSGGTPDVSNRTNAGGQGTVGASATWTSTLPLPPTGDQTWISIRDIGDGTTGVTGNEESVNTTMDGLVDGKVYKLTLYSLSARTNANGGTGNDEHYAGTYIDRFQYQVASFERQTVTNVSQDVWSANEIIFIANSTSMSFSIFPDTNAFAGTTPHVGLETVQIAVELNALEQLDTDNDGIPDVDDVDDDNDGILDIDETNIGGIQYTALGDEDGDKLPNYLDTTDNNGTSDGTTTNYTDSNSDGVADIFDNDLDGIPNHLDLDSDNDGIPDNIEAQATTTYIAPSGSGTGITDANNNGLDDNYETSQGGTSISPINSDSVSTNGSTTDTIPDYLDTDADGDGTLDNIEANLSTGGAVGKNGLYNNLDNGDGYTDVNGSFDNTQSDNFPDVDADVNTTGDVDYRDTSETSTGGIDTDLDGIPNTSDLDDDNDGITDSQELCDTAANTSNTGVINVTIDLDSYEDETTWTLTGPSGFSESGGPYNDASQTVNLDFTISNTGTYTFTISDSFGDGLSDSSDGTDNNNQGSYTISLDGSSSLPGGVNGASGIDPNFTTATVIFTVSTLSTPPSNTFSCLSTNPDADDDSDGIVNYSDPDFSTGVGGDALNSNGVWNSLDLDGDGIPNHLDLDSDNDGIPDNIEAQATSNASFISPSGSGSGITDGNNNGLDDNYETEQGGTTLSPINTDSGSDSLPDYKDTDSDNDGTLDRVEANLILNGTVGFNGLDSSQESSDNYTDVNGDFDNTQEDNFPNSDSLGDVDYRDASASFSDNDGDGIADSVDIDDDNDGILDSIECPPGTTNANILTDASNTDWSVSSGFTNGWNNFNCCSVSPTDGTQYIHFNPTSSPATGTAYANAGTITMAGTYIFTIDILNFDNAQFISTYTAGIYTGGSNADSPGTLAIDQTSSTPVPGLGVTNTWTYTLVIADGDSRIGQNIGFAFTVPFSNPATNENMAIDNLNTTFPIAASTDTDGDGIDNCFDLDSDNDGIPDNIEAQTTTGYNAPSGDAGTTANGLDTAYGSGITPVDTDSDGTPDYIDLDADADGILDQTEAGSSLSGTFGNNGLDNNYDNGDNYTDVNGSFDNTQTNNFPDADGDVNSGGDLDYRDDTFTFDSDGDNVNDEIDLDDDNDGILDAIEYGTCTPNSAILNWDASYAEGTSADTSGDDPVAINPTLTVDNVGITLSRDSNVSSDSNYRINDVVTTNSSYNLAQKARANAESSHIFTFDTPIYGLNFTMYDIDIADANTTDEVEIILTAQDGSNYVLQAADYTVDAGSNALTTTNTFTGTVTNGNGNVIINAIPEWIIKMRLIFRNTSTGSLDGDQRIAIGNLQFCTPIDTDGDTVFNFRDLDSDGDGIPDNIEAQTTANYIAPTGSYGITGIDLAFGTGFTPINTDETDDPDYLDLNSDNEGGTDFAESGLGAPSGTVGTNGLDSNYEDADGYATADINGSGDNTITDNYTDTDGDVNSSGGDLDYRDAVVGNDTDGDGIADSIDIDDDNDGILDTDEGTGDLDGDGKANNVDIDADGDGIPDNVEAQTTTGYITPTGNVGANGLDSAYENNDTSAATSSLPLINTDAGNDALPDYLDTDSDNDGTPDIEENGDSDTTASGTDTDNDGLDDNFEGSDVNDGFDTNDEIETPQSDLPDVDSDVLTTGDVDYRDDTTGVVTPGVAGNLLWLRADLQATTTLWEDQSGNDRDATAVVAPTINSSGLNFNPTYDFNGSTQYMQITNGILGSSTYNDIWVYIVSNVTATQNSFAFSESMANSERLSATLPWGDGTIFFDCGQINTSTGRIESPWGGAVNTFNVWNFSHSNTTSNATGFNKALYRDGLRFATANSFDSTLEGNSSNFNIGSNGSNYHNGEIAEIMVFSAIPNGLEQQNIQSYLAIKYGITLDNTDDSGSIVEGDYVLNDLSTKVWDYTSSSTYHNDVAGIGRDDALALNQKQSKSVNSDAVVTIGLGTIAADNASNSNTYDNNKDFLVWGNDNGTVSNTSTTTIICAPEKTLGRTWKIVETGSVGSVQIAVSESTITSNLNTSSTVKVLKVADDANFTTNVQYAALSTATIDGSTQYVTTYNFEGTKYFTYAEVNGIFWNGDANSGAGAWLGGSAGDGSASTSGNDTDKVMVIDSETSLNHAVLNQDAKVECVWIKENSVLTVADNHYLEFDEDFILDGNLKLVGDAQLLQTHVGQTNVQGTGKVYIDQTATVPNQYRYHYWSSPVVEVGKSTFTVGAVMKDGTTPTSASSTESTPQDITFITETTSYDGSYDTNPGDGVDPITISNYWIWSYISGTDGNNWVQKRDDTPINRGEGFTMKSSGNPAGQNFTFVGTPNDGTINIAVTADTNSLIGNPYPSAVDAIDFINENSDVINGTLYFWQHEGEAGATSRENDGHFISGYQGGYATRNLGTSVAAQTVSGTGGLGDDNTYDEPGRYIAVGQSFFVGATATGNVTFENSHRNYQANDGTNSIFLKSGKKKNNQRKSQTEESSNEDLASLKVGFEYTNDQNQVIHRQIAIAFDNNLTNGYEKGYDSYIYDLQTTDIYWEFPFEKGSDAGKYVITGVKYPTLTTEIPISVVVSENKEVKFMLDASEKYSRKVYLKDRLTETIYEFTNTPIAFTLNTGTYADRFVLSFNPLNFGGTLENSEETEIDNFTIYYNKEKESLQINNSKNIEITEFKLVSTSGLVLKQNKFKTTPESIEFKNIAFGVYIAVFETSKGKVTRKIVVY